MFLWLQDLGRNSYIHPDVDVEQTMRVNLNDDGKMCFSEYYTKFEHCLLTKIFFQSIPKRVYFGAIWGIT